MTKPPDTNDYVVILNNGQVILDAGIAESLEEYTAAIKQQLMDTFQSENNAVGGGVIEFKANGGRETTMLRVGKDTLLTLKIVTLEDFQAEQQKMRMVQAQHQATAQADAAGPRIITPQ